MHSLPLVAAHSNGLSNGLSSFFLVPVLTSVARGLPMAAMEAAPLKRHASTKVKHCGVRQEEKTLGTDQDKRLPSNKRPAAV